MKTSVPAIGKVYFDSGKGYNEGETRSFLIKPTTEFMEHVVSVPQINILDVRFDPIDSKGSIAIRKIVVKTPDNRTSVEGEALAHRIIPLNQMIVSATSPYLLGDATGQDPYFSVEGLSCPTNRYAIALTILACSALTLAIVLVICLAVFLPGCLCRIRPEFDDGVNNRRRLTLLIAACLISLSLMLIVHRGAWMDYLRYSRVAEGNLSHVVQSILKGGGSALWIVVKNEAREHGRIIPAHWLNYIPPYLTTMIRNGDLFLSDPENPWFNRINGDLQTHTIYLLVLLSLATAIGMVWIRDTTGSIFAALLLPILFANSLTVSENLLVNYTDSQDIPQLFWIMLYIFLLRESLGNRGGHGLEIFSYIALLFAYFTKETSIVLGPAIGFYLIMQLRATDPSRRQFITRQIIAHGLLVVVLVSLVLTFISNGNYVGSNLAINLKGLDARLSCAWSSLNQGLFSPVLLCIGICIYSLYVVRCYLRKKAIRSGEISWLEIVLPLLICAGLLILALQWNVNMIKYYMVVMFFGSRATCMLLGVVIHRLGLPGRQWFSWIIIIGSIIILIRPAGEVNGKLQSFYVEEYGYRKSIPLIAEDIAGIVKDRQLSVISVHLIMNSLFQENELAFLRHINKVEQLNLIKQGQPIQNVRAIERNYFRIYPGHRAVEISASNQVPLPLKTQFVYVISRGTSPDEELKKRGYQLEKYWNLGTGYGEVYRFGVDQITHN
jgi:hypothetical protein